MIFRQSFVRFIPGRVLRMMEFQVRARIGHTTVTIPVNRIQGLAHLRWKRTWMTHVLERLVGIKAGSFIDIGANIGQTLLDLQATHPEVAYVGFEPNSGCSTYVNDLIRTNSLSNCTVIPVALADEAKLSRLYCHVGAPMDDRGTIVPDLDRKSVV